MKSTFVWLRQWISLGALAFVALALPASASADDDYNFEHYASYEKGCKSIIFKDRREQCGRLSDDKKKNCIDNRLKCELAVQKKTIEDGCGPKKGNSSGIKE